MASIVIPNGKKLVLRRDQRNVTGGVPLVLEESITLSLSSSFSPLISGGNKTVDIAGGVIGDILGEQYGFSSQFKEFGFQTWDSTDPLSFNATVTFRMGTMGQNRALPEVYTPALRLAELPLPKTGGAFAAGTLENLQPPGPPASSIIQAGYGGQYAPISMKIGNILYISDIIVKKAEPTYSTETDSEGYPIWAQVNLDIQSVETATVEMINAQTREDAQNNDSLFRFGGTEI